MEQQDLTPAAMKRGGYYNWKGQPDRLIYLRRFNGWHQFKKIGDPRDVWCEVLDGDLNMLEETPPPPRRGGPVAFVGPNDKVTGARDET